MVALFIQLDSLQSSQIHYYWQWFTIISSISGCRAWTRLRWLMPRLFYKGHISLFTSKTKYLFYIIVYLFWITCVTHTLSIHRVSMLTNTSTDTVHVWVHMLSCSLLHQLTSTNNLSVDLSNRYFNSGSQGTIIIVSGWLPLSCCCGAFIGWTSWPFWPIAVIGVASLLATRFSSCILPLDDWKQEKRNHLKSYSFHQRDDANQGLCCPLSFFVGTSTD